MKYFVTAQLAGVCVFRKALTIFGVYSASLFSNVHKFVIILLFGLGVRLRTKSSNFTKYCADNCCMI